MAGGKTPPRQTVGQPMLHFKKKQKNKFDYNITLPPPLPQAIRETKPVVTTTYTKLTQIMYYLLLK